MYIPHTPRIDLLSQAIDQQTDDVLEQLDCIEDTMVSVQSDVQQLRLNLTRLESLRSKYQAINS